MKKFKLLSVFLLLISIINILFPQQIFAAKTKYVLVSESGDYEDFSFKERFSPKDTDINFFRETAGPGGSYDFKYTYNKKGQLTKAIVRQDIGTICPHEHILTYKYDKKGRLVKKTDKETWQKSKSTYNFIYTYKYNKKNQLIQIKKYYNTIDDQGEQMSYTYNYYSNGNIKSCVSIVESEESEKWTFYSNGNIKSYYRIEQGKKCEDAKYDSHGNLVKRVFSVQAPLDSTTTYTNIYNNDILEKTIITYDIDNKDEIIYYTEGVLKGEEKEEYIYHKEYVGLHHVYEYKLDSTGKHIVQKQKYKVENNGKKILRRSQKYKWKKISIK